MEVLGIEQQTWKGHLDLLTLAVLADGPNTGTPSSSRSEGGAGEAFDLPEGTVYPALHRLEKAGHLTSEWSVVQGRRRRTYRLTGKGRSALGEQKESWARFAAAVGMVLGGAAWPATT